MATAKEPPTTKEKRASRLPKSAAKSAPGFSFKGKDRHLLVFTGGRKPTSAQAAPSCICGYCCDHILSTSTLVHQHDLEMLLFRARQLNCVEKRIALALLNGAKIGPGCHTAELVPARGEDGHISLKLVSR
jgi:hypothetical protein